MELRIRNYSHETKDRSVADWTFRKQQMFLSSRFSQLRDQEIQTHCGLSGGWGRDIHISSAVAKSFIRVPWWSLLPFFSTDLPPGFSCRKIYVWANISFYRSLRTEGLQGDRQGQNPFLLFSLGRPWGHGLLCIDREGYTFSRSILKGTPLYRPWGIHLLWIDPRGYIFSGSTQRGPPYLGRLKRVRMS